ncbi:hypothetical protein [Azospirillum palustre]|nr:hypothetical protein [Azospirillum palustre]
MKTKLFIIYRRLGRHRRRIAWIALGLRLIASIIIFIPAWPSWRPPAGG